MSQVTAVNYNTVTMNRIWVEIGRRKVKWKFNRQRFNSLCSHLTWERLTSNDFWKVRAVKSQFHTKKLQKALTLTIERLAKKKTLIMTTSFKYFKKD